MPKFKKFRPFAFARKLIEDLGIEPGDITDAQIRELARKGAERADALIVIPGSLGTIIDASGIDRAVLEWLMFHALDEARDALVAAQAGS